LRAVVAEPLKSSWSDQMRAFYLHSGASGVGSEMAETKLAVVLSEVSFLGDVSITGAGSVLGRLISDKDTRTEGV
jgi:hypothetical protein